MTRVKIYTKNYCPFCARAKKRSQRKTVPQIFIDGVHVGGSDDLIEAERSGELDRLLGRQATAA
jgi:glutaredoxin 3